MRIRIPTHEEYAAFDGAHAPVLWASHDDEWQCPGCGRTKFQCLRWTKRNYKHCRKYRGKTVDGKIDGKTHFWDWLVILHRHHDHSVPLLEKGVPRFEQTVICSQCNVADGAAKRKLGLPKDFSFSPSEIRQFVKTAPHGKHVIDIDAARQIYGGLSP